MPTADPPIRIVNPRRLPAWQLPAERIPVGIPGDYKPSMALLPDGELVMVALFQEQLSDGRVRERTPLWRSSDGGRTWSKRRILEEVIGREQWLTCLSDGVLLMTSHLLAQDVSNQDGCVHSYVHRSTDGGRNWERTKILVAGKQRCGVSPEHGTHTSRNVLEMPDGTLLLGVSLGMLSEVRGTEPCDVAWLWRSEDRGASWSRMPPVTIAGHYDNADGFFAEDFTYRAQSGKLRHWIRVGPPSLMYPMWDGRVVPRTDDSADRTMLCESQDEGRTWTAPRDFGNYGMMYVRPLRLRDGRLLLTFTQRALFYPIGLQAVLSRDDGETWEFDQDRIIIEGRTPWGMPSGGGFGNTVQLEDGSLVSCYTYRGSDDATHLEVARWLLP